MTPRLSVVIASVNGLGCILECLEKLEALPERGQMEILVMDRRTDDTARTIAERFPWVTLETGLTGKSIPELRWIGMRAARGEWVAVIEDHCLVTPNWASEILRFSNSPYGVVGGPVENGSRERILDWAFFLAEYGPAMPPLPQGETEMVPGNNAAYRRKVLPLEEPAWATLWESFLQKELRRRVIRIFLNPTMLVYHKKSFRLGEMLEQRFLYSRSFAAMRARRMTAAERLLYTSASLLLPGLLLWRIVRCVVSKSRNLRELLFALPAVLLFVLSWGVGEMAGYLAGAGGSLERVE
ncbi:MAG: glycosyltransferase [Acidobacteria bacterium]|nr:glycosyltransferase [Acidobacteriota bacterium]